MSPRHDPGCASITDGDYGPCSCSQGSTRAAWLDGYEYALTHLTDPGVLADSHRLAIAREKAEEASVRPRSSTRTSPHGTTRALPTPAVEPPPPSEPGSTVALPSAWGAR